MQKQNEIAIINYPVFLMHKNFKYVIPHELKQRY